MVWTATQKRFRRQNRTIEEIKRDRERDAVRKKNARKRMLEDDKRVFDFERRSNNVRTTFLSNFWILSTQKILRNVFL